MLRKMGHLFRLQQASVLVLACLSGMPGADASAQSIPDMLERTLPAVVTIAAYKGNTSVSMAYGFANPTSTSSDIAYAKNLDLSGAMGSGSGFIVEKNGKKYIVTNAHVIDNANDENGAIYAFSINRTKYPVKIVGADTMYDVAVLEFTDRQPGPEIEVVQFREAGTRIGEEVFAIGNPLGNYPYTVTQGIIGAKNRVRDGMTGKFGYLQSSATTIWGNSGGPLIDTEGKVVGISSQIEIAFRKLGVFVQPQINFALEAGIARRVVDDLIDKGKVARAYMGILVTQTVNPQGKTEDSPSPRIDGVIPRSPAASVLAGKEGYYLRKINGVEIRNVEEALGEFENVRPGSKVTLELEENKERFKVVFTSDELTQRQHAEAASYFLRSFAGLDLSRGADDVIITPSETCADSTNPVACRVRGTFSELDPEKDKYDELEGCHEEFHIRSAGIVLQLQDDKFKLWKVRNPANMGLILRIAALNGMISFAGKVDEELSIVNLILSDDGVSMLRTLMY